MTAPVARDREWTGRVRARLAVAALAALAATAATACGRSGSGAAPTREPPAGDPPATPVAVAPAAGTATPGPGSAAPAPAGDPVAAPPAPPPPPPREGHDFADEARLLYRMVACAGDAPIPDEMVKVVDRHCKWVDERLARYRERYVEGGREFFDELVPDDVPKTVVYPFGGGDLISALVAFPDADETTTISLELAGDPRRIKTLSSRELRDSLSSLRGHLGGTLSVGSNTSVNLSASQRNELPAQVSSFLLGLAANGFEPVGMRYVRLQDDGSIHYLTDDEIAVMDGKAAAGPDGDGAGDGDGDGKRGKGKRARARKGDWLDPNFSEAFAHVEIEYRKLGDPADRVRVHRHFGWNLHDSQLADHPQLITHLAAKGQVTVLVKGGSYLLWRADFSAIRDYLLEHLAWMLSDSTGIPPAYAKKAGMVQDTYGRFSGAFLEGTEAAYGARHSADFRALFQKNPKHRLPFRFGYVDANKSAHLIVTRPAP